MGNGKARSYSEGQERGEKKKHTKYLAIFDLIPYLHVQPSPYRPLSICSSSLE